MLSPIGTVPLRPTAMVASPFTPAPSAAPAGAREPSDRATLSASSLAPSADAATAASSPGRAQKLRSLALVAMMALGGIASAMGGNVAMAAEPGHTVGVTYEASKGEEALARRARLSPAAVEGLKSNADLRSRALELPASSADAYGRLNDNQRNVISRLLTGKTRILFVTIDNREAFVNGKVAGQDAFPHMLDKIDEEVENGALTPAEGEQMKASMGLLKGLTPEQRDTVARLVALDRGK